MNSLTGVASAWIKRFSFHSEAGAQACEAHWYPLTANLAAHPLLIPRSAAAPDKPRALWQRLLDLGCMRHGDALVCCIAAAPFVHLPSTQSHD